MYIMISVIPSFFRGKQAPVTTPEGKAAPGHASNMWPTGTIFVSVKFKRYARFFSYETFFCLLLQVSFSISNLVKCIFYLVLHMTRHFIKCIPRTCTCIQVRRRTSTCPAAVYCVSSISSRWENGTTGRRTTDRGIS